MNLEHKTINKFSGDRNFNSSELVFDGLSIDKADYCLHGTCRDAVLGLKFNGDATANNRLYNMQGSGASATASVNDATTLPSVFGSTTAGKPSAFRLIITGSQDTEKFINSFASLNSAVLVRAIYYKDAILDLTSITVFDTVSRTATADIYLVQIPRGVNLDQYDLVDEVVFENRSTDIVFSGLNGDVDEEYLVKTYEDAGRDLLGYYNALNSVDKISQRIRNTGSLLASNTTAGYSFISNRRGSSRLFAKSNKERLSINSESDITGTIQEEVAIWEPNTLENITDITITNLSNSTGKESLYKKKPHKTIDPVPMDTLFEYEADGDFSGGITINNLQGDRFEGAFKIEVFDFVGNSDITMQMQSVTSNSNQSLQGISSGTSATPSSPSKPIIANGSTSVNNGETWCYLKSGQNRPCLNRQVYNKNSVQFNYITVNESVAEVNQCLIQAATGTTVQCTIRFSVPKNTTWTTKPTLTVN